MNAPTNPHRARTRRPPGVKVPKTAEVIARHIRKNIRENPLTPGDPLPSEAQLREQFEASRASVREALRLLESQQLVRIARGATGGARFSLPDISMVAEHTGIYLEAHRTTQFDFHEARLNLEPSIIGFIAERATPEHVARLHKAIAVQKSCLDDPEGFAREHEAFYEILAEICPNNALSMFLLIFRDLIRAQTNLLGSIILIQPELSKKSFAANIRAKEKLVGLFSKHDRPGAETLWRTHLEAQFAQLKASGGADILIKAL